MQRTVLIVLTTAVLAAGIAAGATILLTDDDDAVTVSPPPATPFVTVDPSTASPASTDSAASPAARSSPAATAAASGTASPGATTQPTSAADRRAASVDCDDEPNFCSDTVGEMEVADDRLESLTAERSDANHSGLPTVKMTSRVLRPDDKTARVGDDVQMLHVEVLVHNGTNDTFVFTRREIVLDIYRNGRLLERLPTKGDGFDMTPDGEMRGKFEQPIMRDGTYTWQAKVWYRKK